MLIFTMGGIGQNMQFQSDGSEIVCAIRAPHKTYAYQVLWQNCHISRVYIWGKMSVPDIKNLGLVHKNKCIQSKIADINIWPVVF